MKQPTKVCPLLAAGVLATPGVEGLSKLDLASEQDEIRAADRASACLTTGCAWFMTDEEGCAVWVLARPAELAALLRKRT